MADINHELEDLVSGIMGGVLHLGSLASGKDRIYNSDGSIKPFDILEKQYLSLLITETCGDITASSKISGIPCSTLYRRINRYGLKPVLDTYRKERKKNAKR